MFRKVDNNEKPVPKDENVRKEAQEDEKLESAQQMGNEAANIALLNQMLREANADNAIDLSGRDDSEEEIIPNNPKKGAKSLIEPGADDPNNSMYLNSSHNIVNENNIDNNLIDNRISLGGMRENNNDINNLIDNQAPQGGNNGPAQNVIAPLIQNAIQQAAGKPDFYTDPEGPDPALLDPNHPLNRDMVVEVPRLKKKKKGKSPGTGTICRAALMT